MQLTDHPLAVFAASLCLLSIGAWMGAHLAKRRAPLQAERRDEFEVVRTATLTLLALLIGFAFSMAISRYDQRKYYEEAEANAIGTEYVRADLLPGADAAKVRALLLSYLDQRIQFYEASDEDRLRQIRTETDTLQAGLWAAVRAAAQSETSLLNLLTVEGMNDVLNSEGYTQFAWWNRIPGEAWALMLVMAFCCNVLVGFGATKIRSESVLLLILPLVVSIAFFLIADIDSPRGGMVHVKPQNLHRLARSLRAS